MTQSMFRRSAKGLLGALVAVSLIGGLASTSDAAPILFDPDGAGGLAPITVQTFDELPGNALAQGAQTLINNALVGLANNATTTTGPFVVYYQANISLLTSPNGVPFSGGNAFTAVAKFFETATVTGGSNTVTFNLAANQTGSYFDIFAHTNGAFGNNAAGTGFSNDPLPSTPANGILIYSATPPTSGPSGNFTNNGGVTNLDQSLPAGTGQQTVNGTGSTQLNFNTTFFNPTYFVQNPGTFVSFQSTNSLPFFTTTPSAQFQNLSGAGAASTFLNYVPKSLGTVNGSTTQGGPDVQFQADGSSSFNAIPEPASVAMTVLGLGGMGLGLVASRRKAARA